MWETLSSSFGMLQASCSIILQNWYLILHIVLISLVFAEATAWLLSETIVEKDVLGILSFIGGFLGFSLFSLGLVVLKITPSPLLGMAVTLIAIVIAFSYKQHLAQFTAPHLGLIAIFFLLVFLLRLIFVQGSIAPPYADSIEHVRIVQDFLNPNQPPQAFYQITTAPQRYYHFGFHAMSAWLSGVTSTSPAQTILILGQYIQALAIIALYPLAYVLARNSVSAWIVMGIAGLILPIPAYVSNWGKYPALASLIGICFNLALLAIYSGNKPVLSKKFWWLLCLTLLATTSLHTRSLFIFLLAACLLFISQRLSPFFKHLEPIEENTLTNLSIVLLIVILFNRLLALNLPIPTFFLYSFIVLTIPAFLSNMGLASFFIIFLVLICVSPGFQFPSIFHPAQTLTFFDRPFLVIFAYIPICLLYGMGIEGCIKILSISKPEIWKRVLLGGVIILGTFNAIFTQDHLPAKCCIYLDNDDLFSFEWMKQNLPSAAIVGIAATGQPGNYLPADGGGWIEPLTGIRTRKLDTKINFADATQSLCHKGIYYLYVDNLENSFDLYNIIETGGIHQFSLGTVSIYQINCKLGSN